MQKSVSLIVFMVAATACYSQHILQGRLLSATDKKPVPYANIGIVNSTVGTLSNEDGSFKVTVPEKYYDDTLIFSAIGFERANLLVKSILRTRDTVIVLNEKVTTLNEVVIKGTKQKHKTYELGNRYNNGGFLYADSLSAGAAMALLIENKFPAYHKDLKLPYAIETANIFISTNSLTDFKLRVRFLERDSATGAPAADMFTHNIIVTSSIKKGWLPIDLKSYRIIVDRPFYLVIEWIMDEKDRLELLNEYAMFKKANPDKVRADSTIVDGKKVGFWSYLGFDPGTHLGVSPLPFSLQHYTSYYRTHSFDEWKRAPVVLTARVEVAATMKE